LLESDLRQWRVIEAFNRALQRLGPTLPAPSSWSDPERELQLSHYLSLFLFGLVNPILKTTRALSAASKLSRVQRELCGGHTVSLGSFSVLSACPGSAIPSARNIDRNPVSECVDYNVGCGAIA
jgi:hypothetical protein